MKYRQALSSKKLKGKEELDELKDHYRWSQQQILTKLINDHDNSIKDKME